MPLWEEWEDFECANCHDCHRPDMVCYCGCDHWEKGNAIDPNNPPPIDEVA